MLGQVIHDAGLGVLAAVTVGGIIGMIVTPLMWAHEQFQRFTDWRRRRRPRRPSVRELEIDLGYPTDADIYPRLVNAANAERVARGERPGWYDPDDDPRLAPVTPLGVFAHPDVADAVAPRRRRRHRG